MRVRRKIYNPEKKPLPTWVFLVVVLIFAGLSVVLGSLFATPTNNSALATAEAGVDSSDASKVGDRLNHTGYILTVNSFQKTDTISGQTKVSVGNIFVTLDLSVENERPTDFSFNCRSGCTLLDSQQNKYPILAFGKEPALVVPFGLSKGQQRHGWITFQVPTTAANLVFRYIPPANDTSFLVYLG